MVTPKRGMAQRGRLPKAAEILAEDLRGQILSDGLEPGAQLTTEAQLIADHGFSRGTVREALRLLEGDGIIEVRRGPRGGIRVTRPDLRQISRSLSLLFTVDQTPLRSFFQFRKLVEPFAARLAAENPDEQVKEALADLALAGGDDPEGATSFHRFIGESTGDEIFRVILTALHAVLDQHVRIEALNEIDDDIVSKAHSRIARAIADGDANAAERAMRRHLEAFEAILEEQGRLDKPIVPRSNWRA